MLSVSSASLDGSFEIWLELNKKSGQVHNLGKHIPEIWELGWGVSIQRFLSLMFAWRIWRPMFLGLVSWKIVENKLDWSRQGLGLRATFRTNKEFAILFCGRKDMQKMRTEKWHTVTRKKKFSFVLLITDFGIQWENKTKQE